MKHSVSYTELEAPEPGKLTEVGPGIFWIRMPVPFHPSHINVFLLEDQQGWYIVDTGIGSGGTREIWQQICDEMMQDKPLLGVIATHLHPDHIGLAGWLCDKWQAQFFMTQREYLTARALFDGNKRDNNWELTQFYQRCGLSSQQADDFISNTGSLSKITSPLPISYERIEDGQTLEINGQQWKIIVGYGHSPEHACLYCEELNIMISGDQILPKISPNISVQSLEPNHSPLTEYLTSMEKFYQVAQDCLVLPAHGEPFTGLHRRLDKLKFDHKNDLELLLETCKTPIKAVDSMAVLYKRELKGIQFRLGLGEALAHLNHLWSQGLIERTLDDEGCYQYRTR